jgi:outer membrane protein OmpA-like peptidoglycan-associated protein
MISENTPLSHILIALLSVLLFGCSGGSDAVRIRGLGAAESVPERKDISVKPMTVLNSVADDLGLTMPLDTTMVLLTSARKEAQGRHSIFYSRLTGADWNQPKLAVEVNNEHSNGMPVITPDGNVLYFTGCDYGLGDCDLYRVDVGPQGAVPEETIPWSIPSNLGLPVNGSFWESQCCVSADGGFLYFSSDRPGGLGGKDIWISRRSPDGSWERPFNAGERINTAFDEITPWASPDGQTLIFSSNGHPGLGGFDIFSATISPGGTSVENLGTPINSTSDDISFSMSADGKRAFMASNRGGGVGGYDLYRISSVPFSIDPLMVVRGRVTANGTPQIATVEVTDLTTEQHLGAFLTNRDSGSFAIVLPRGFNYALTAQAPGFLFNSKQLVVPIDLEQDAEQTINFELQPISGQIRLLVFFDENDINLRRESGADLDRLVAFLTINSDIRIEVAGHTDNTGDAEANRAISEQRAQAVKSYLVGNRIDADRIKVSGYGSSQPIADNNSEEGRAMNRRVEVRIITLK